MEHSSQYALLRQRRFLPFFLTQLCGALNDNLLKNILVLLATYQTALYAPGVSSGILANIAAAIFILPFVLFSATAGQLADRYDKAIVMRVVKVAEVGVMLVATAGLLLHSLTLLLAALACMGVHSAFFGPVKYSILPKVLTSDELVGGNALVESGTNVAILAGTIAAGAMAATAASPWMLGGIMLTVAVVGAALSFLVPRTGSAAPTLQVRWNPVVETARLLSIAHKNRPVWLSLIGISWFWFFGALLLALFPSMAKTTLHGDASVVTLLLTVFSVGVAAGSLACERLSRGRTDIGLVPFGSIGMSVFAAHLCYALPAHLTGTYSALQLIGLHWAWPVLADLALTAFFGGLFIVPLYALVQQRTPQNEQSRVIAANNVLNALFMVASAALGAALVAMGASVAEIVLVGAVLNAFAAVYIYSLVPEFLWRFVVFLMVHTAYRVRVKGLLEAVPENGPALLLANHVSFIDALVLQAEIQRPIRFMMDHGISQAPVLRVFFRAVRAIPIASAKTHPEVYEKAFELSREALAAGELVAIFPEGRLTADGRVGEFRPGYLKVVTGMDVPVVALGLGGFWGSTFSRKEPTLFRRFTVKELFRRVGIVAAAVPHATWGEPALLRDEVIALKRDAMAVRR